MLLHEPPRHVQRARRQGRPRCRHTAGAGGGTCVPTGRGRPGKAGAGMSTFGYLSERIRVTFNFSSLCFSVMFEFFFLRNSVHVPFL